jgi:hypothetical protein
MPARGHLLGRARQGLRRVGPALSHGQRRTKPAPGRRVAVLGRGAGFRDIQFATRTPRIDFRWGRQPPSRTGPTAPRVGPPRRGDEGGQVRDRRGLPATLRGAALAREAGCSLVGTGLRGHRADGQSAMNRQSGGAGAPACGPALGNTGANSGMQGREAPRWRWNARVAILAGQRRACHMTQPGARGIWGLPDGESGSNQGDSQARRLRAPDAHSGVPRKLWERPGGRSLSHSGAHRSPGGWDRRGARQSCGHRSPGGWGRGGVRQSCGHRSPGGWGRGGVRQSCAHRSQGA